MTASAHGSPDKDGRRRKRPSKSESDSHSRAPKAQRVSLIAAPIDRRGAGMARAAGQR
jgi:hypothetical protein